MSFVLHIFINVLTDINNWQTDKVMVFAKFMASSSNFDVEFGRMWGNFIG